MPHSDAQGKDVALGWYQQIQPTTVVDVGAGCGTYAKLMRQPGDTARWTAVEAWQPYLPEFELRGLYDQVVVADARHLNWSDYQADLVIAGDVLEHMGRDDAKALLRRIKHAAANLIVSIPVLHLPQGAANGNPYERHVDHWSAGAMAAELGGGVKETWVGSVLGYFWWSREVTGG
ncbi:MAG: methyltransferase domain-containing protein [Micromonosporaceae bacterium]|nr:methyltransferase domain-containing protein [Micromonosporaceae bacterium]